jgi:hypothetical protein
VSWREKLHVADLPPTDTSDKSTSCVTCVSVHEREQAVPPAPDRMELNRARAILNQTGVRIMQLDGVITIGIWSDLDGPEIRAALRTMGSGGLPIRYLDGAGIPSVYKLRRVGGEPVPMNVLTEMERQPEEPWKARNRVLKEMGWYRKCNSVGELKAARR